MSIKRWLLRVQGMCTSNSFRKQVDKLIDGVEGTACSKPGQETYHDMAAFAYVAYGY